MHYVEQGQGPPVVLCHGFPAPVVQLAPADPARSPPQVTAWSPPTCAAWGRPRRRPIRGLRRRPHHRRPHWACSTTSARSAPIFAGLDFGAFAIYDLALRHPAPRARGDRPGESGRAAQPRGAAAHRIRGDRAGALPAHRVLPRTRPRADEALAAAAAPSSCARCSTRSEGAGHYLDVLEAPARHRPTSTRWPRPPPLPWPWLSELELEFFVSGVQSQRLHRRPQLLPLDRPEVARSASRTKACRARCPRTSSAASTTVDLEGFHGDDPIGADALASSPTCATCA
jgi:hypothetical protein